MDRTNLYNYFQSVMKSISQIMLIEKTSTGLLITIAFFITSWKLGLIAISSAIIALITAYLLGADKTEIKQGLFGYNSVLTGIALYLFLQGPYTLPIALCGAVLAVLATAFWKHFMGSTNIPVLTMPFIILTWFMLLMAYRLNALSLSPDLVPQFLSHEKIQSLTETNWQEGFINGFGQIFFIDHNISCLLILLAVFLHRIKSGLFIVIANIVAIGTAYVLGADSKLITLGLYSYNGILTMLVVSYIYDINNHKVKLITGIFGAFLSILMTASVSAWMLPYGLPVLTMPFVLSSWFILAARKVLPNL